MLQRVQVKNSRGMEILDELAEVLPGLYDFDKRMDLECAAAVKLISSYWKILQPDMSIGDTRLQRETMRLLNRLLIECSESNVPMACGIFIMACHIESSYLTDDAARLVHDITDIHIHRAASIMNTKSIAA
jgi:hypothetical protein